MIDAVPDRTKKYTEFDMIRRYAELPEFPQLRARLLQACLDNREGEERAELYTLATSLAQMAMDTHDLVPEVNEAHPEAKVRSRQLKVLAGDYFSSIFYNLLSKEGLIELVAQLSGDICEVNRLKLGFYERMKKLTLTPEGYLLQLIPIKMQLFLSFRDKLRASLAPVWPALLERVTSCDVLQEEMQRCSQPQQFACSWAFWHIHEQGTAEEVGQLQNREPMDPQLIEGLLAKYNIRGKLYRLLEHELSGLLDQVKQLELHALVQDVYQLMEQLFRHGLEAKAIGET